MSLALMAVTGLIELNPGCTIREPVTTTSCRAAVSGAAVVGAAAAAGSATETAAALASASRMARRRIVFFDIILLQKPVGIVLRCRPRAGKSCNLGTKTAGRKAHLPEDPLALAHPELHAVAISQVPRQ